MLEYLSIVCTSIQNLSWTPHLEDDWSSYEICRWWLFWFTLLDFCAYHFVFNWGELFFQGYLAWRSYLQSTNLSSFFARIWVASWLWFWTASSCRSIRFDRQAYPIRLRLSFEGCSLFSILYSIVVLKWLSFRSGTKF